MRNLILSIVILMSLFAYPQQKNGPRYYNKLAVQAYLKHDYKEFLKNAKNAFQLSNTHQSYIYNLAIAYLLNNEVEKSLKTLKRGLDYGLVYPLEGDKDLDSVRNLEEFKRLLKQNSINKKEKVVSKTVATLPVKQVIAEGLGYDSKDSTFFISSIYNNRIYQVDRNKNIVWESNNAMTGSISGIKVDRKNNLLWCTFVQQPQSKYYIDSLDGNSGIICYDLKTKEILHNISVKKDSLGKHWFGDLILDSKGNIYASDSYANKIYKFSPPLFYPTVINTANDIINMQGMTFTTGDKYLIFADYTSGLYRYDTEASEVIKIKNETNNTLLGIDGIYLYKDDKIIVVQNGINPQRILEVTFNKDFTIANKLDVLEVNNPDFDEVTLGTISNGSFYFIANSQWGKFKNNGDIFDKADFNDIIIKELKLD